MLDTLIVFTEQSAHRFAYASFSVERVGLSKSFVVKIPHSRKHFAESGVCWQSVSGGSSGQVANSIAGDIQ